MTKRSTVRSPSPYFSFLFLRLKEEELLSSRPHSLQVVNTDLILGPGLDISMVGPHPLEGQ